MTPCRGCRIVKPYAEFLPLPFQDLCRSCRADDGPGNATVTGVFPQGPPRPSRETLRRMIRMSPVWCGKYGRGAMATHRARLREEAPARSQLLIPISGVKGPKRVQYAEPVDLDTVEREHLNHRGRALARRAVKGGTS